VRTDVARYRLSSRSGPRLGVDEAVYTAVLGGGGGGGDHTAMRLIDVGAAAGNSVAWFLLSAEHRRADLLHASWQQVRPELHLCRQNQG